MILADEDVILIGKLAVFLDCHADAWRSTMDIDIATVKNLFKRLVLMDIQDLIDQNSDH